MSNEQNEQLAAEALALADMTDVVEAEIVETPDVPHELRIRNGVKGPGSISAVFATKADAQEACDILAKDVEAGTMAFIKPVRIHDVLTLTDWKEQRAKAVARKARIAEIVAKLSPEDLAMLGDTVSFK